MKPLTAVSRNFFPFIPPM